MSSSTSESKSLFTENNINDIIKKVEFLKTLYYSPNTYKICSLEPEDINNIFFGNQYIYIKDEGFYNIDNKTDENKKEYLFKCFIDFIYIDITDIDIIINPNNYYDISDGINNDIISKLINNLKSDFETIIKNCIDNFINKDNDSYLQIYNKINEEKPYIEYNQNSKRLFIKNFIDLVLDILKTSYIIKTNSNDFLIKIIIKILSNIKIDKIKNFNNSNIVNITTVDTKLQEYSNDTIITYLKIRNTPVNYDYNNITVSTRVSDYNKSRFNIKLYGNAGNAGNFPDTLLVKYNNKFDTYRVEKQINSPDSYTNEYLFGPFNRIYNFDKKNKQIADELNDIVNSLENKKDVFIIGYGASGSGKTSTLVYLKNNNITEEGIIIHVCKRLTKTYNKFNVKCREFFTENNTNIVRKIPVNDEESISFTFKNNSILLDNDFTYTPKWISEAGNKKTFNRGDNIGDIILYLIDKDRFVEPTTNNPKSSRSHSLVFIELIGDGDKKANFIIGDFAGVENKFDCQNDNAKKFYEINTGNDNYYLKKFEDNYKEEANDEFNDSYYQNLNYSKNKNYDHIKTILLNKFFKIKYNNMQYDITYDKQKIKYNNMQYDITYDKQKIKYNNIENFFIIDDYQDKLKKIFKTDIENILKEEKDNIKKEWDKKDNDFKQNNIFKNFIENSIKTIFEKYFETLKEQLSNCLNSISNTSNTFSSYDIIKSLKDNKIIGMINFSTLSNLEYLSLYTNNKNLKPEDSFIIYLKKFINDNLDNIIEYWKGLFNTVVLDIKEEDKDEYEKKKDQSKQSAKEDSKQKYIENICETRTKEGIYINESLKDVRSFITMILKEKNKNKISISPQFINKCFPYYCNSDRCFDINTLEGNSNSAIFKEIQTVLKADSLEEYIRKIIISVFCVFNIGVNVNNPPPIPYVDINNIQIIFNKYNNNNFESDNNFKNEYITPLDEEYQKITELLNNYNQKDALEYTKKNKNILDIYKTQEYSQGSHESVNKYVKELIDFFNNFNSISSIGTVEFLDKISKFNLTNVICGVSF